ncbi:MAG TPA: hypothetical protein VGF86_14245 [Candidatus Tumulicola sp.]|jgi:hypothetical protein
MMHRLQGMTVRTPASASNRPIPFAPAEPLVQHAFADGTGSIGIPADWSLKVGGGGSAVALGPRGGAQVSYNMAFTGTDPSNPRAQMFMKIASPLQRQTLSLLPYTGDPIGSWKAMYGVLAQKLGLPRPQIQVTSSTPAGATGADITGTLGTGASTVRFIAHVLLMPPNPNGMWTISDSHIFVKESELARQGATAKAVLDSVRINFGALVAQENAIRQSFQREFEAQIANDRALDAARQQRTDEALASDRAAQEGMHRQAVAMENYSLDRAVVVDTATGAHSTVDSGFASTLVRDNPNYQQVPAADLLRGVDY